MSTDKELEQKLDTYVFSKISEVLGQVGYNYRRDNNANMCITDVYGVVDIVAEDLMNYMTRHPEKDHLSVISDSVGRLAIKRAVDVAVSEFDGKVYIWLNSAKNLELSVDIGTLSYAVVLTELRELREKVTELHRIVSYITSNPQPPRRR